jgi:allophanate hydrolase
MVGPMTIDLGVHNLRAAYGAGTLTCRAVIDEVLRRIAAAGDDKVWISRVPDAVLRKVADTLDARRDELDGLSLYGIPFAVKDNIDVEGLPTTAACPGFAYTPKTSATVVKQLVEAGAIVVGKTNLDQFATGLVGVRSPYGVPRNPFNADYIPGGSSSGSAVAVSSGLVSFSLGTDTAGSGRVPAGFNNIIGVKPTPGRLSNKGTVPACASLDCVSIFALSCADAAVIVPIVDKLTPQGAGAGRFSFGVPRQLEFFGDGEYAALYADAVRKLESFGGTAVPFDYTPFREAAQFLYGGPWVAERAAAVGKFIEASDPSAKVWPVTRDIILRGFEFTAVDAFEGQYRLKVLRERAAAEMQDVDFLALPTASTIYTVADLEREPVLFNSNLGHYTNFVNFFRLPALALPAGFRRDGLPFGITFVGHPNWDRMLLEFGAQWQRAVPLPLGKTASRLPEPSADPTTTLDERLQIAVVGAHMSGLPLNKELLDHSGRFERSARTAPEYRLYSLSGGPPQRPGMLRRTDGGASIELEIWSLPVWKFAEFVSRIPTPLGIGTVTLEDGTSVQGFLCESYATEGARDITDFGGWRAYLKSLS